MKSRLLFHPNSRNWCVLYMFLAILYCFCLVFTGEAYARGAAFKLQSIRGKVEVQSGGKGKWSTLRPGVREASEGDHIRTGADGSVYIVTDDGARVALGSKTEVALREPDHPKGWRVIIGKVKTSFVGSRRLEVRTPGAIAAAEGTTFQLDVADDGASVLTVVEGTVQFYNELGSVRVLGSQQSTARVGQAPSRPIVVDPASLTAWEANLQTLIIPFEYPLVGVDSELLAQELTRRRGLVDERPQDAAAHADLAEVLIDLHRTEEAVAHAQQSAELAPDEKRHHGILGFALLQAGRPGDAGEEFEKAAGGQPDGARWQMGQALVDLGRGDAKTAVGLITEAAKQAPNDAFMQACLGAASLRLGNLEQAQAAITDALKLDPNNYVANAYLAYIKLAQGQVEDAVTDASKAVSLAPGSALAHEALGNALTFAGKSAEASQELDRALELSPLSSGAHLARAKLMAAGGEIENALQEAQVAVSLDPQSSPGRSTLGLLYLLNNDPERAGHQFQAALTSDPSLSDARTGWGRVLQKRGRFREAIEQQKLAVSTDTDSASAQNNLGGVYASIGQMQLAQERLDRAIELQPGWGMPYANLAIVYLEQNRFAEALEAGERAVALGERSAFAHTVLARIYVRQGRTDRALSELREAVALDENYPQAHFQLAKLYLEQDRSRDAVREILNSVVSDPSAMLETRSYARTENTLSAGSYDQIHYDLVHSNQSSDGRLSYFASGLLDSNDGFRSVNQDGRERFAEVIVGRQSQPTRQLVFFGTVYDRNAGMPGAVTDDSAGDPDDRQDFNGLEGVLAYRQRLSPRLTGTLKYSLRRSRFILTDPDSLPPDRPFLELRNTSAQQSPEIRLDATVGQKSSLSLGYTWLRDRIRQGGVAWILDPDTWEPVPDPFAELNTIATDTAWLELKTNPNDRLQLTFGGYWGRDGGVSSVLLPKAVARYRLDRSSWFSFAATPLLHADASELSPVEALADPKGLTTLDFAEGGYGRSYELRYQRQGGRSRTLSASVAYQRVNDLLVGVEDPAVTGLPARVLINRGHRWVADSSYEQWLTDNLTGRVWVRWQSTSGGFPDEYISGTQWPYVPRWQAGGRLDYINAKGVRVGLEAIAVGKRFDDPENLQSVGGYLLFNLRVQYQRNLRQNYFVSVMNLAGKDYESFAGYPQSGRTVLAGVEYRY